MLRALSFLARAIDTATAFLAGGPVLIGARVAFVEEEEVVTMRRCWRKTSKTMRLNIQKMGTDQGQVLDNLIIKN